MNIHPRAVPGAELEALQTSMMFCLLTSCVGGRMPDPVEKDVKSIAKSGGTPLVIASKDQVLGTIHLRDIVKGGLRDRFARFRAMGIARSPPFGSE